MVLALALANPPGVVAVNRGNHEDGAPHTFVLGSYASPPPCLDYTQRRSLWDPEGCNRNYAFDEEVAGKYDEQLYGAIVRVFNELPLCAVLNRKVFVREQQIGGSGGSLEPPGPLLEPPWPLLTHLRTVYMVCSECLPTRLHPLVERPCFSQATPTASATSTRPTTT